MIVWILIAAAAVTLLWPVKKSPADFLPLPKQKKVENHGYIEAVSSLQVVRQRLASTQALDADEAEAINILTLALVKGSEE
jgi:hypothetical protein